jgi:cytochrome P450
MSQQCEKPEEFVPERYMNDPTLFDPRDLVFGFGRRTCPGKHFAEVNIWLAIARIVATFDISPLVDKQGEKIIPPAAFTDGFIV